MSEREEVQREFASGDWHHELGTIYNIEAMADEIVRLRSRLAAVTTQSLAHELSAKAWQEKAEATERERDEVGRERDGAVAMLRDSERANLKKATEQPLDIPEN